MKQGFVKTNDGAYIYTVDIINSLPEVDQEKE